MTQNSHGRRLVLGAVALTKKRNNRYEIEVMTFLRDKIEIFLIKSGFFEGATFSWISLVIQYGLINSPMPKLGKVNVKYGDLPVSIEVDANQASSATKDELRDQLLFAAVQALVVAGRAHSLDIIALESMKFDLEAAEIKDKEDI